MSIAAGKFCDGAYVSESSFDLFQPVQLLSDIPGSFGSDQVTVLRGSVDNVAPATALASTFGVPSGAL